MNAAGKASATTITAAVSIAEAIFSRSGTAPPPARLAFIARELEDFLLHCGRRSRLLLTFLIRLVAVLAPLFVGRLTRLSTLPLAERVRALSRLEARFGEPLLAVKAMLCLLYYEHPDAASEVGFDGACAVPRAPRALPTIE